MDDEEVKRVLTLVDAISNILAGIELAQAHTALTLAVVSNIVATVNADQREQAAEAFSEQVRVYIARPDIVEWIEQSVISRHGSTRAQ